MQTKGFIVTITVALILICAFYLSFSFVNNHYESQAQQVAMKAAGIKAPDEANKKYTDAYAEYIRSIEEKKVYLGFTYQQVREKQLGLGLDLKGGMNITLQINVPDIIKALAVDPDDETLNKALNNVKGASRNAFVKSFCEEYKKLAPNSALATVFSKLSKVQEKPNSTDDEVRGYLEDEVNSMVDNSFNVLRTRIDRFGVVAPNIQKTQSTGRILLELPGVKEPERVKKLLQGTANLEFYKQFNEADIPGIKKVLDELNTNTTDTTGSLAKVMPGYRQWNGSIVLHSAEVKDTAAINKFIFSERGQEILGKNVKLAWTIKPEKREYTDEQNRKVSKELLDLLILDGKPVLTGDVVTDATTEFDQYTGRPNVSMKMNDEGARKWSNITEEAAKNNHQCIAIILDDQVYSYPRVNDKIDGGSSQITGNFTVDEANDLSNVLKSGKMVARVDIAQQSVIGPSLGKESINKGLTSFIVALILLMIFMVCVYGFKAGSIANLGLVLNLFFTFGILASFQSVLTLPGIAGIVLALGMAVDANVLIFERIKEELRAGKNLKAAVADGYSNAFSAIFDSNLTSIITGIILAMLGTGPIKGFAITTIIGICCSFFTAVFATRVVMEFFVNRGTFANMTLTTPWTRHMMENVKFDFMGKKKTALTVVCAVVLVAAGMFAWRGLNVGIDFSGGRNYIVQLNKDVTNIEELQNAIDKVLDGNHNNNKVITIDNASKVRVSTNYKYDEKEDQGVEGEIRGKIFNALKPWLGNMSEDQFSESDSSQGIISSEQVDAAIAGDMVRGAIWAVFFALLAMFIYILLRFRKLAYSVGAVAAVAFTAFVVISFYTLYGWLGFSMDVDQTFIAAILTVIGYQVNDTVVVFDRVREYRGLYPKQDLYTTFNRALSSTLARTMMTSITTLLVLLVVFFLGGESLRGFIFAMILGVIIGTCSSLFIASPVAYAVSLATDKKQKRKAAVAAKN
ncbi:MAG: protein translocase subunit SecD [Muribaculaceae bacterium]|nr:protein translocase subunit SecD [Muribaculaceae bacterium]